MALAGFVSGPVGGLTADRRLGHERALTLIAGGAAPLALLCFLMPAKLPIAAACVLLWAWKSPQLGIADSVALARLGGRRAGYGSIRLWLSGGFAVCAVAWGAVLQETGARAAPLVYASMLAVVALMSTRLTRGRDVRVAEQEAPARSRPRSGVPLAAFLASLFLLQTGFWAAQNFFALRVVDLGGGAFLVGLGNALQAAVEVPVMAHTSRRSSRRRPLELFVAGCVCWAVVFAGWALLSTAFGAVAVNLLGGVAFALTAVSTVVIVDELVPLRFRATGQTLSRAVGGGLAPVVGNVGGGLVYGTLGSGPMFALTALCAGVAAVTSIGAVRLRC
jgi:PPP family 3-phenylpropionic acid transporter